MTSLKDCPLFPSQALISRAEVDAQLSQTSPCPLTFLPASNIEPSSSLLQPPLLLTEIS